jgi:predicted Fe-S protein YdhL (DUF1289 family)
MRSVAPGPTPSADAHTDDRPAASPVLSPCVRMCTLDDDDVCVGCGRTLDDIKGWIAMPDEGKRACIEQGHARLTAMGLPIRTGPDLPGRR